MLSTPKKRFVWARPERFADFTHFSLFRAMLVERRPRAQEIKEERAVSKRWKPAKWTPWLWMKT
jgi:hypothetical protein